MNAPIFVITLIVIVLLILLEVDHIVSTRRIAKRLADNQAHLDSLRSDLDDLKNDLIEFDKAQSEKE